MSQKLMELKREMISLYWQQRYEDALELVRSGLPDHPDERSLMTFWTACLECMLGHPERALATLSAFVAAGGWVSPHQLKHDSDLTPLRGHPEFDRIIEVCEERRDQGQTRVEPRLLLQEPAADSRRPPPLLLALHMMGGTADETLFHWRTASQRGVLLAAPQGTDLLGPGAFAWSDDTADEIRGHLEAIGARASYDPNRVVVGGASQGARMAVLLAMDDSVAARGFIAVVGAPPLENLAGNLDRAREAGVRGVFITGENDGAREGIEATYRYLEQGGLAVLLVVVPGLGHDYPADFADYLSEALDFVLAG